jgi:hypothetical protein
MAEALGSQVDNSILHTLNEQLSQLEQWRGQIRESFNHLSSLAEQQMHLGDHAVGLPDEEEAQSGVSEIQSHFEQAANALENELIQALDSLGNELQTCRGELEGTANAWVQAQQDLQNAGQECGQACQQVTQAATEGFGQFDDEIQNLTQLLQDMASQHGQEIDGLTSSLANDWPQQLLQSADPFHDDLGQEHPNRLLSQFQQSQQHVLQLHDNLHSGAQEIEQDFDQTITNAFQLVGDHVSEQMNNGLQQSAEHLVKGATRRFGEEVVEGVVMSEMGVGVTTTLSPYLPELVAIKEVADVLIDALITLRELKRGDVVGGLFG